MRAKSQADKGRERRIGRKKVGIPISESLSANCPPPEAKNTSYPL